MVFIFVRSINEFNTLNIPFSEGNYLMLSLELVLLTWCKDWINNRRSQGHMFKLHVITCTWLHRSLMVVYIEMNIGLYVFWLYLQVTLKFLKSLWAECAELKYKKEHSL